MMNCYTLFCDDYSVLNATADFHHEGHEEHEGVKKRSD